LTLSEISFIYKQSLNIYKLLAFENRNLYNKGISFIYNFQNMDILFNAEFLKFERRTINACNYKNDRAIIKFQKPCIQFYPFVIETTAKTLFSIDYNLNLN
jgi:hypothetical protein